MSIESLEALLADSLQCLDDAAGELREQGEFDLKRNLRRLGIAINEVWRFREEIHRLRPDLKPPFVAERDADPERYDRLQIRANTAYRLEEAGDYDGASAAFAQLRLAAQRGCYTVVAEAGLLRALEKKTPNKNGQGGLPGSSSR